jgi:hypothetical protein
MEKDDFRKGLQVHEEIIDGVRVVHTGEKVMVNQGYKGKFGGGYENLGYAEKERLEMYDSNGNRFYSNCSSLEEAEKLVEKLKKEGKNAIIGPKAPWKGKNGEPIKNQDENAVGVYIVKEIEKQKPNNDEKEPAK